MASSLEAKERMLAASNISRPLPSDALEAVEAAGGPRACDDMCAFAGAGLGNGEADALACPVTTATWPARLGSTALLSSESRSLGAGRSSLAFAGPLPELSHGPHERVRVTAQEVAGAFPSVEPTRTATAMSKALSPSAPPLPSPGWKAAG
jgi:hypothetical protein